MVAEGPVVVDSHLDIGPAAVSLARQRAYRGCGFLLGDYLLRVADIPVRRRTVADLGAVVVVAVEAYHAANGETFGHEVQFLVQLDRAFQNVGGEPRIAPVAEHGHQVFRFVIRAGAVRTVGKPVRVGHRGRFVHHREDRIVVQALTVVLLLVETSVEVETQFGGLRQRKVEVRTEVDAFEIGVRRVFAVELPVDAFLRESAQRHVITHVVRAAAHIDVEFVHRRRFAQEILYVVVVGVGVGRIAQPVVFDILFGERRASAVVGERFVAQHGVVVRSEEGRETGRLLERERIVHVELRRAFRTAFGRDQDHAVGAAHAVYRRRRSVLQHGELRDILRIDLRVVAFDAVHQHQRSRVAAHRGDAAHIDFGVVAARTARRHGKRHAGHFAGQRRTQVGASHLLEVFGGGRGDGSHHALFFLYAVTYDHDLLHIGRGGFHRNGHRFCRDFENPGDITDIGGLDRASHVLHLHREPPLGVGDRAVGDVVRLDDAHTHHRSVQLVHDRTRHRDRLGAERAERNQNRCK